MFKEQYYLKVTQVTGRRALLNLHKVEDRDKVITLHSYSLEDCMVNFSAWSPGVDTLSSAWFQRSPRWLTLVGTPYHLVSEEIVKSLTCRFGNVKKFSSIGKDMGGFSRSRVLIENCDVRLVPQFASGS